MNNQDWTIIQKLYEYKNITKTAEALFLSQPALTARIKKIEDSFDVPLVVRHRRGVQFTSEGEYLAQWSYKIIKQNEQIKDNLNNMKHNVGGILKIGVSRYMAKYKLPKILQLFKKMYPHVEFKVFTNWSGEVYKRVANRDIHVGFVRGDYPWDGKRDLLFEETLCVSYTEPFEWTDLPGLPRIVYNTDHRVSHIVENWWAENYDLPPYISMEVDQVDTCKEMIVSGLGYGILPSIMIEGYPTIYKKVLHHTNGVPVTRKTWLYYHNETLNINMVQAFISFVHSLDIKNI